MKTIKNGLYASAAAATLGIALATIGGCATRSYDAHQLTGIDKPLDERTMYDLHNKASDHAGWRSATVKGIARQYDPTYPQRAANSTGDERSTWEAVAKNIADITRNDASWVSTGKQYEFVAFALGQAFAPKHDVVINNQDGQNIYHNVGFGQQNVYEKDPFMKGNVAYQLLTPAVRNLESRAVDETGSFARVAYVGGNKHGGVQYFIAFANNVDDTRLKINAVHNLKAGFTSDKGTTQATVQSSSENAVTYTVRNDAALVTTGLTGLLNIVTTGGNVLLAGGSMAAVALQYAVEGNYPDKPWMLTYDKPQGMNDQEFVMDRINRIAKLSADKGYPINGITTYQTNGGNTTVYALSSVSPRDATMTSSLAKNGSMVVETQADGTKKILIPAIGLITETKTRIIAPQHGGGFTGGGPQGGVPGLTGFIMMGGQ